MLRSPVFGAIGTANAKLHAEIAPKFVKEFQDQYFRKTKTRIAPGIHFQVQPNKYGRELRVYFDASDAQFAALRSDGHHVEGPRDGGYLSGSYRYRINDMGLFWDLVSDGFRL